ncbi:DUF2304 domain-containing protein [bacterium]|nr:DUF2304 domain-containing protein [bacterium]
MPESSGGGGWLLSFLGLALSALCLVFALWPQGVIDFIISTPYETRVRVNMGGVSILVLLITFEAIRSSRLQERYALLWIATALVVFTSALFPQTVSLFRALTGMEYATALVAMAFAFLILVAFHFSVSISSSRSKAARVAQKVALLEERLLRLEEQVRRPAEEEKEHRGCPEEGSQGDGGAGENG